MLLLSVKHIRVLRKPMFSTLASLASYYFVVLFAIILPPCISWIYCKGSESDGSLQTTRSNKSEMRLSTLDRGSADRRLLRVPLSQSVSRGQLTRAHGHTPLLRSIVPPPRPPELIDAENQRGHLMNIQSFRSPRRLTSGERSTRVLLHVSQTPGGHRTELNSLDRG
ncbi:hypothetical protein F2P81_016093 [Scophthalmus maximus]|uniref:Uncharacterized protein n=1 Tax=Scophthalmus maximus TaxID=52904 RepID=A0A6A4SH53_SCOMX|nr:hypothetical protein F2P81_016093 [Scophthalmus maximus]